MTQTQENGKKHFGLDLGLLGPNSGHKFFFFVKLIVLFQAIILGNLKEN